MPCGSRSEYRPRPGVRRRGFRGAVVFRHRAAKHCPAAALRPASVTRLLSAVFGRRGCLPCDGALCRCRGPGRPGRGVRAFACASGNPPPEAHALCEQGILPLSRKRRAGLLRPAIPPKRMLCANKAFSRSPAKGGRASCVRPVPMPRSRGCRALRRVRRCGAVRRVRPFRAWGRVCRGRASRP